VKRLFIAISVAALLGVPAFAGAPASPASEKIETPKATPVAERTRRSTVERWRGGPVLRSRSGDDLLRAEALDKALPPANEAFGARLSPFSVSTF
jgi:hypothetical protein